MNSYDSHSLEMSANLVGFTNALDNIWLYGAKFYQFSQQDNGIMKYFYFRCLLCPSPWRISMVLLRSSVEFNQDHQV